MNKKWLYMAIGFMIGVIVCGWSLILTGCI